MTFTFVPGETRKDHFKLQLIIIVRHVAYVGGVGIRYFIMVKKEVINAETSPTKIKGSCPRKKLKRNASIMKLTNLYSGIRDFLILDSY